MVALPHAKRSEVFNALFNLIKTVAPPAGTSWGTQSQSLVIWDEVSAASQPALFLHRGPQTAEQTRAFGVTKWHWKATIWIYYRVDGLKNSTTMYPDQLTDQFIDNFEQTFQTDPLVGPLTLGGLVYHCWIDGSIFTENGINDGQAIILIPISILI